MRFSAIAVDTPRSELWHTPESIDVIADIPYLPDGGYDKETGQCRGHLLDLYLPPDTVLRGGKSLPVYIDIHGGGVSNQGEVLLAPVRAYAENETRNITTGKFPAICACTLRNDAGVIGAAALENSI